MKTLEEASNEYRNNLPSDSDIKRAFEAGVRFIQRFIPINESMPEDHKELLIPVKTNDEILNTSYFQTQKVIVKYKDGSIELIRRFGKDINNMLWASGHYYDIIEWRPTEYK